MTTPANRNTTDGMLARILAEQGKQGRRLAVISEQLKAVPDHESRLRSLESSNIGFRAKFAAASVIISAGSTWIGLIVTRR